MYSLPRAPRKVEYTIRFDMHLLAVTIALLLHVHLSGATYSCCSEERRGTVCTLAGNGTNAPIDSPNASTGAIYGPIGLALYPPQSILVTGQLEHRVRIIYHNGSVGTLAGGGPPREEEAQLLYADSDDPLAARFWRPAGVCYDNEGTILLCDYQNNRIRAILRNGSVRTLAGSGGTGPSSGGYADNADPLKAQFHHPHGIASVVENGQRLIIIGGHFDHRIRAPTRQSRQWRAREASAK